MKVAEQIAGGYVSHNVLYGREGPLDVRGVVHR